MNRAYTKLTLTLNLQMEELEAEACQTVCHQRSSRPPQRPPPRLRPQHFSFFVFLSNVESFLHSNGKEVPRDHFRRKCVSFWASGAAAVVVAVGFVVVVVAADVVAA